MNIVNNPVFYERTKHIEVDYYFSSDMILIKQIVTFYVISATHWWNFHQNFV